MGLIKKTRKRFNCEQDPKGKVICKSFRELEDGTRQNLASLKMSIDTGCNIITTDMNEFEEGELEKLEKKVINRVVAKCRKNKPEDY